MPLALVAVLGHRHTAGRRSERNSRGNVEGVGTITTGSTGVDHQEIGPFTGKRACLTQNSRHRRQFLRHQSFGTQGGEEATGLNRRELLGQPGPHQGCRLLVTEMVTLDDAVEKCWPGRTFRGHGDGPVTEKNPGATHSGPGDGDISTIPQKALS